MKAFLVRHQVEFPKTHDIAKLLDRVAAVNASLAESLREAEVLTPFGTEARYPSDAPEILPGGDTEALGVSGRVKLAITIALQPYLTGE